MTMRNVLILCIGTIIAGSLFAGCKKDEVPAADLGYGYYPNKVGAWIEYQVDSLWRDDAANVRDSVSYRLMEKVVEAYTDPVGRPAWRIHRFIRNANDEWVVRDVWTRTVDAYAAEMMEENNRRLKLSFPVSTGRSWNMNVYNTEDPLEVTHREIGTARTVNGLTFAKTTLVKSTVVPNLVDTLIFSERYADGVGMIEKRWVDTNTQTTTVSGPPPVLVQRTKGWYLTMTVVAFGND